MAASLQLAVQLPLGGELQDEVDARSVVEVSVQTQDVRVSEEETWTPSHRGCVSTWGVCVSTQVGCEIGRASCRERV